MTNYTTLQEANQVCPKRKGYYYGDGKISFKEPYVGVTTVLDVLPKGGLMFWYAGVAVNVALDDPSKSVKEIMAETAIQSKSGATRGTGVHNIAPKILRGEEHEPYPEQYKPYIDGFVAWVKAMKPKILMNDTIVYSDKYKYAGTLDAVVEINGRKVLVDFKTGKDTYFQYYLQLSAYKQALEEAYGYKVNDTAILLMKGDGAYVWTITNEPFSSFLKVKEVWELLKKGGE